MSNVPKSGIFVSAKKPSAAGAAPASGAAGSLLRAPKDVKKRWLYVGGGVIGLVILTSTIFADKPKPIPTSSRAVAPTMINTDPPNVDKDAFTAKFAKDLEGVKARQIQMEQELLAKDKKIEELTAERSTPTSPAGIVPPPVRGGGNTGGLGSLSPVPAPPVPTSRTIGVPPPVGGSSLELPPTLAPIGGGTTGPLIFDAPAAPVKEVSVSRESSGVLAKADYKKNAQAGLIPAGAFAPISLLNGVDAGTATSTQSNPLPVLMRITDQATLPGAAKYKLKSCFALASAYGDLSAERVYARISRLSCVDKADRLILSQEVQGYLVDSDGKLGMRGMITDRQGAKVGKALLAGFAQGLAGALGTAQGSVLQNATTGTSTNTITGDAALRAAGLSGAQTAASQLAQFYLKEAQSIFPVITIDAGRTGTIVFSASTALTWSDGDSQFVQQVTPTNK